MYYYPLKFVVERQYLVMYRIETISLLMSLLQREDSYRETAGGKRRLSEAGPGLLARQEDAGDRGQARDRVQASIDPLPPNLMHRVIKST